MAWIILTIAIILEVAGTTCMKLADGFSRPVPAVLVFLFYGLSFTALIFALRRIDLSVAYAIWSGLGTALVAVIAVVWFEEPMDAVKVASLLLIVAGVAGLHLGHGAAH